MEVVVVPSKNDGSELVGGAIADLLTRNPEAVLGLATGSTPLGVYDDLVRRHTEDGLSFARAKGFALDEYVGLPPNHPESYRAVIKREIADRVDFARIRSGAGWMGQRHSSGLRRVRSRDRRGRWNRSADPRRGHRRPHRVQRADLIVGVIDPDQDVDRANARGQRAILRRRPLAGSRRTCSDPGGRHDSASTTPRLARVGRKQRRRLFATPLKVPSRR